MICERKEEVTIKRVKMTVIQSRKLIFGVMRLKNVYEMAVRKRINKPHMAFSIDTNTAKGKRNFGLLKKILELCEELKIDAEKYVTVMVEFWIHSKNLPSHSWQYPYLSYLASENGFNVYKLKLDRLRRRYKTEKAVDSVILSKSPLLHEKEFINCFYQGFSIIKHAGTITLLEKSTIKLFTVFLAYADVFTPEFVVTHSRYYDLREGGGLSFLGRKCRNAIYEWTSEIEQQMIKRPVLLNELTKTRQKVGKREKQVLADLHGGERWIRTWKLLV